MATSTPYDDKRLRKMFHHAELFRHACQRLSAGLPKEWGATILIPLVILSAFAVELYIKCLIRLHGSNPPPTHDLKTLFLQLPRDMQLQVEDDWIVNSLRFKVNPDTADGARAMLPDSFFDALDQGSHAFEEWRYFYEDETKNPNYSLFTMMASLQKIILEIKPEWAMVVR